MNAIVALCHFCEAHGPCILFCTQVSFHTSSCGGVCHSLSLPQAFHSAHDAQLLMDSVPPDKRVPFPHPHASSGAPHKTSLSGHTSISPSERPLSSMSSVSSLIHPPPDSLDQCEVSPPHYHTPQNCAYTHNPFISSCSCTGKGFLLSQ